MVVNGIGWLFVTNFTIGLFLVIRRKLKELTSYITRKDCNFIRENF